MDYPIKPLRGLWRTPSETTSPPGSCKVLNNCCIRRQGLVEPLPDWTSISTAGIALRMFDVPGDDILVIYDNGGGTVKTSWFDKDAGTETAVTVGGSNPTYENGTARLVRFRDRYYLTSKEGLLCLDSAGDGTARRAGFPPPYAMANTAVTTTDAVAIANGKYVGYRAIFRRDMSDGSIVVSPPTAAVVLNNSAGATADFTLTVYWEAPTAEVIAGDYVELYRTDAASTDAVGDTYRLVTAKQLSASDISNEYIAIKDVVIDASLGVELYTNPGQHGLVKAYFPPPYLRDVVLFKGALVGIAYNEAYSFTMRFAVSNQDSSVGLSTNADRRNGVGRRKITGDTHTNTTIDNISASDMLGLAVGQVLSGTGIVAGTQITVVGATSVTVDTATTATNAGVAINADDVIEVDGVEYTLLYGIGTLQSSSGLLTDDTGIGVITDPLVATDNIVNGFNFSLRAERAAYSGQAFGIRGTSQGNYTPNIPALTGTARQADDDTQGNRIAWSEPNQPEHWPLVNRDEVGQGEILRLIVAGDICYIFNDQGEVYAMTGEPDAWVYTLIATDVQLATPGSACAYEGSVYAWTNQGLIVFSAGAIVANLSNPRISRDLENAYINLSGLTRLSWLGEVAVNEMTKEVWLITGDEATLGYSEGQPWLYNMNTDEWYRYASNYRAPVYVEDRMLMYVAGRPSEAWSILYDSGGQIDSTTIQLNRLDLGQPGVLKKWQQVVWHFAPSDTGSETFSFTTNADKEAGGAAVSTSYSPTFDATDSVNLPCHVARNTGMTTTMMIKLTRATAAYAWAIEGITVRYVPLVDRTGARAA